MKVPNPALVAIAIAMCHLALPARAALPTLDENVWLSHYIGFEGRHLHFGFTADGDGRILVVGKNGQTLSLSLVAKVQFEVQETLPDGKVVTKAIQPASLESAQPAGKELKNVSIRGKVTGDAAFELLIHEDRGVLSFGGRVLDPGTLKNPLALGIRVTFPNLYPYDKERDESKIKAKAFENKVKGDRMQVKWTNGKSRKLVTAEAVDASSAEVTGPGIEEMEFEFAGYQGKKFEIVASENSSMTLRNPGGKPLHDGFSILWKADAAKDPEGRARLLIEAK